MQNENDDFHYFSPPVTAVCGRERAAHQTSRRQLPNGARKQVQLVKKKSIWHRSSRLGLCSGRARSQAETCESGASVERAAQLVASVRARKLAPLSLIASSLFT